MKKEKIAEFLGVSRATVFNYANEGRPIVKFCEKYLTDDDIDEFIQTGRIQKFEVSPSNDRDAQEIVQFLEELNDWFTTWTVWRYLNANRSKVAAREISMNGFILFLAKEILKHDTGGHDGEHFMEIALRQARQHPTIFAKFKKFILNDDFEPIYQAASGSMDVIDFIYHWIHPEKPYDIDFPFLAEAKEFDFVKYFASKKN